MNELTSKIDRKIDQLKAENKEIIAHKFAQLVLIDALHKQYQEKIDHLSEILEQETETHSGRAFQSLIRREVNSLEELQLANKTELIDFVSHCGDITYPEKLVKNTLIEAKKFIAELGSI